LSFDGRYAVNLDQGEFLCPLCKRLCNIVCPIVPSGPPNSIQATGSSCVYRVLDHLSSLVSPNNSSSDSQFSSRFLSALRIDGAYPLIVPIFGACLGYTSHHNKHEIKKLYDCFHSLMLMEYGIRDLSTVLEGRALASLSCEEVRFVARQWNHLGGVEVSHNLHLQWRRTMKFLTRYSEDDDSLPEWVRSVGKNLKMPYSWKYVPLLCWDLTVLAGILFATTSKQSARVAHDIAGVLLIARLMQILTLPQEIKTHSIMKIAVNSVLRKSDLDIIQKYNSSSLDLETITSGLIPFCRTACSILEVVSDSSGMPPHDDVWGIIKYLDVLPSSFDPALFDLWTKEVSTLQEGLHMTSADCGSVRVTIENDAKQPSAQSVEVACPNFEHNNGTEDIEDVSMASEDSSLNDDQVVGFCSAPARDLSYFGLYSSTDDQALIRLPNSFVHLYSTVSNMQFMTPDNNNDSGNDDSSSDDEYSASGREIAICMLTGKVMLAGSRSRGLYYRPSNEPGQCTLHARHNGAGVGIFFLLQKCATLLLHNEKSAYSPSLYVDEHGEEDVELKRGRPLYLQAERFERLQNLWLNHDIPGEVTRIRSTSDRVIRDNWY